jgi:hypothetical protein
VLEKRGSLAGTTGDLMSSAGGAIRVVMMEDKKMKRREDGQKEKEQNEDWALRGWAVN